MLVSIPEPLQKKYARGNHSALLAAILHWWLQTLEQDDGALRTCLTVALPAGIAIVTAPFFALACHVTGCPSWKRKGCALIASLASRAASIARTVLRRCLASGPGEEELGAKPHMVTCRPPH